LRNIHGPIQHPALRSDEPVNKDQDHEHNDNLRQKGDSDHDRQPRNARRQSRWCALILACIYLAIFPISIPNPDKSKERKQIL
jgi:hypothetical protein